MQKQLARQGGERMKERTDVWGRKMLAILHTLLMVVSIGRALKSCHRRGNSFVRLGGAGCSRSRVCFSFFCWEGNADGLADTFQKREIKE
jgi:hypothetical protein